MITNHSSFQCSKLTQEVQRNLEKMDPEDSFNGKSTVKPGSRTEVESVGLVGQSMGLGIEVIEIIHEPDENSLDHDQDASEDDEPDLGDLEENNWSGSNAGVVKQTRKAAVKMQCLICKTFVSRRGNLIRHHKRKHGNVPLALPARRRRTPSPNGIIDPENEKPFSCPDCPKVFKTKGNLRVHIRIHRPPGMKLYSCTFCDSEFVHRSSWTKHLLKHSDLKSYSCSKCDFTSNYHTSVYHHEKTCYGFRIQDDLAKKNRQLFHCDLCGKSFTTETGVYNHKIVTDGNCKVYACSICGKKFYRESLFKEHEDVAHTDEYPFPCPLCDSKFKVKANLRSHTRNSHTARWVCPRVGCTVDPLPTRSAWRSHLRECSKPILCSTCEQIFESQETFAAHTHPIQCDKCEKSFPKKSQMDIHLPYHDPLNVFKCEDCTFGFGNCGELTTHKKMRHRIDNRILEHFTVRSAEDIYYFTCKFCDAEFDDPSSTQLADHTKTMHADKIGQFICPTCGKGFEIESTCFAHHNRVHGIFETEFHCEPCKMYFLTKHGLDTHNSKTHYEIPLVGVAVAGTIETSENSKQPETSVTLDKFSCLICGKKCMDRGGLRRHSTLHKKDKEFKCELCVRSWAKPASLNKHNSARHPDLQLKPVPAKCFECPHCDKTFYTKASVRSHTRIHSNEKPFKCGICDKGFRSSDNQIKHMVVHSGEKAFSCDFCGTRFARIAEQKLHIKRYHKIDVHPLKGVPEKL